jgi:2'-5' RNA ligase
VAQSVELLLDDRADAAIRNQWNLLAEAGLPSERRPAPPAPGGEHHGPHVTLFAAEAIPDAAEQELSGAVAGLDLELQIGALMIFGPRRGRAILVRQVTPTLELLRVQATVAALCGVSASGVGAGGQFGPGRWSPHVTLARRLPPDRLADALTALDRTADRPVPTRVTACRRWDGIRKTAWLL